MRLPGFRRDLQTWCLVSGLGLSVVALLHIRSRGLGAVDQLILVNGESISSRPLTSTQGLILGMVGLAWLLTHRSRTARLLGLCFVAIAVICQNRSDWASLLVAAAALLLLVPGIRRRVVGYAVMVAMALAIAYTAGLLDPLISRFSLAYHSRGTFVDRQFAWRYLISQQNAQGPTSVLIGQPYGTGFARRVPGGSIETFAPHNWYVLLYLRIGLVGAGLVTFALLRGFWTNVVRRDPLGVAWAAGLMTYCFAYNLQFYVAPILAVALTARAAAAPEPEVVEQDAPVVARVPATAA
jgi:O-antigen ligase